MNRHSIAIILFLSVLLMVSCENPIDPDDMVPVEIHLTSGFAGKHVILSINGEEHLNAQLSESSPFSAPKLKFSTQLERGELEIEVMWAADYWTTDTVYLELGNSEEYFLALHLGADAVSPTLQDTPFLYL
ncbi:MAG: hypothetical protein K9M49_01995 [Candidatus Marinimicrobia bacterium]|nr:hypothetical protein [Candidatus Neomarinimicrobiota bacterium]MCF7850310.1 hypothetical protein [Candidatus Neomarinimicrobiota bacterium]MCF7903902.1 hypothetical protein [Candidatus Neomarinimicrobiota bacterium]